MFVLNGLNSIRYVDGVLAVSELFLAACLGLRIALPLVAINSASRLMILYLKLSPYAVAIAAIVLIGFWLLKGTRWSVPVAVTLLVVGCPLAVERNRRNWTTYWNDLKPTLDQVRSAGLAELALEDGGYFAGHIVAAGNPVSPGVRSLLSDEIGALPPNQRPRYLTVLVTPGSESASSWRDRYIGQIVAWGYHEYATGRFGGVYERNSP
jgi:hypothetical protein